MTDIDETLWYNPEAAARKIARLEGSLRHAVDRIRELEDVLASKLPPVSLCVEPVTSSSFPETVRLQPKGGWVCFLPAYEVPQGPRRDDIIRTIAHAYSRQHSALLADSILRKL